MKGLVVEGMVMGMNSKGVVVDLAVERMKAVVVD
jgi:hypothetical protein